MVTSHSFSNILPPSFFPSPSMLSCSDCEAPCRSAAAKRNCESQHFYARRRLRDEDSPVSETEKREAQELLRFLFAEKLTKRKGLKMSFSLPMTQRLFKAIFGDVRSLTVSGENLVINLAGKEIISTLDACLGRHSPPWQQITQANGTTSSVFIRKRHLNQDFNGVMRITLKASRVVDYSEGKPTIFFRSFLHVSFAVLRFRFS